MDNERWLYEFSLALPSGTATQGEWRRRTEMLYTLSWKIWFMTGRNLNNRFISNTNTNGGGRTLDLFQGHVYGNLFSFCFVPKTSNKSDASPGTSSELSMLRSGLHLTRLKAHWYLAVIAISSPYSVHTISNRMLPVSRHLIEFGWGYLTSSVGPGRYSLKGPVQGSLSSSEALLPEGTTGPKIAPQR